MNELQMLGDFLLTTGRWNPKKWGMEEHVAIIHCKFSCPTTNVS
jgi:hypothetical protein